MERTVGIEPTASKVALSRSAV